MKDVVERHQIRSDVSILDDHIMENVIFTGLKRRCFDVAVGSVVRNSKDKDGKSVRSMLEVDFVVNRGSQRYYMQSALHVDTRMQETESLKRTGDSFRKLVIVKDPIVPWHDDDGILYVGIEQFLLDEHALDL